MKALILTLSLTFFSAPAFAAPNVDPSCGGSKLLMRGTIFIAFALANEPTSTGDESYDRLLRQGVKDKFSKDDAAQVQALLDANPNLAPTLALKADEFREKGLKGAHYMHALVEYFMDPDNGLCQK
jgi:hypothetical protein